MFGPAKILKSTRQDRLVEVNNTTAVRVTTGPVYRFRETSIISFAPFRGEMTVARVGRGDDGGHGGGGEGTTGVRVPDNTAIK